MSYYLVVGGEQWTQVASIGGWKEFREWVENLENVNELLHLVNHGWNQNLGKLKNQLVSALNEEKPSANVKGIGEAIVEALDNAPKGSSSCLLTDGLTSIDDPDDSGWISS